MAQLKFCKYMSKLVFPFYHDKTEPYKEITTIMEENGCKLNIKKQNYDDIFLCPFSGTNSWHYATNKDNFSDEQLGKLSAFYNLSDSSNITLKNLIQEGVALKLSFSGFPATFSITNTNSSDFTVNRLLFKVYDQGFSFYVGTDYKSFSDSDLNSIGSSNLTVITPMYLDVPSFTVKANSTTSISLI